MIHIKPGSDREPRRGGGLRSEITEFSRASRRRMQQLLNSIDRVKALVPILITLTYHEEWPEDPAAWKDQLDAFRKRLERKYGQLSAIWRLEYQRRGAPHFHLLCFFWSHAGKKGLLPLLQMDVGGMWWEVTGRTSEEHLRAGTRCELPRSWKGANVYLSKYMAKLETLTPGQASPGRFWGVWRKELIPILYETFRMQRDQAIRAVRILRKYAGIRPRQPGRGVRLAGFSCFLSYSTSLRLLAWLVSRAQPPDPSGGGGAHPCDRMGAGSTAPAGRSERLRAGGPPPHDGRG